MYYLGSFVGSWVVVFFLYWLSKKIFKKNFNPVLALVVIVILSSLFNSRMLIFYLLGALVTYFVFETKRDLKAEPEEKEHEKVKK